MLGSDTSEKSAPKVDRLIAVCNSWASSFWGFMRSSPIGAFGVVLLIFIGIVGLVPGLFAPYDPDKIFFDSLKLNLLHRVLKLVVFENKTWPLVNVTVLGVLDMRNREYWSILLHRKKSGLKILFYRGEN